MLKSLGIALEFQVGSTSGDEHQKSAEKLISDLQLELEETPQDQQSLEQLAMYDQNQWFVEIEQQKDGESFGDLALVSSDPRTTAV